MSNFLLWLVTLIHALGFLGGMAFLVLAILGWVRLEKDEYRCRHCSSRRDCPAYDSGVSYPCQHFQKKKDKP